MSDKKDIRQNYIFLIAIVAIVAIVGMTFYFTSSDNSDVALSPKTQVQTFSSSGASLNFNDDSLDQVAILLPVCRPPNQFNTIKFNACTQEFRARNKQIQREYWEGRTTAVNAFLAEYDSCNDQYGVNPEALDCSNVPGCQECRDDAQSDLDTNYANLKITRDEALAASRETYQDCALDCCESNSLAH
ncbi:MAG: hypothetical protein KC506_01830 [Nanoarchaeota archaeon]|nr:hypothetical protein [Nanoarchaeota archaeon]